MYNHTLPHYSFFFATVIIPVYSLGQIVTIHADAFVCILFSLCYQVAMLLLVIINILDTTRNARKKNMQEKTQ